MWIFIFTVLSFKQPHKMQYVRLLCFLFKIKIFGRIPDVLHTLQTHICKILSFLLCLCPCNSGL